MPDVLAHFSQLEALASLFLGLLWPSVVVAFSVVAACWAGVVLLFPLRAIVKR